MTDAAAGVAVAVRALLRRAGHELRNAQSAAAVNLEVVRSRVAAGTVTADGLQSFAENASKGLDESARLADGLIALCSAVTAALAVGDACVRERIDCNAALEISLPPDLAERLASSVAYLAERTGLGVERTAAGVILRIPPDYETSRA